ncbi:MAG: hypothetical protein KatS3mg118_2369 [Paracoccaceae bacterium]|nr:MAG: GntR family transcriptional regulator [Alphaproteobacteria bacterium]GIX14410.1 MAG: hypothetical protein KatS3mg118_2369 [Paracoccaceae bacterium]
MARVSHKTRIYELYLGRIQRGEIGRGVRLVDTAIAAELGVSRMPVRDALMRLAHEGYLTATSRGFTLPDLGPATIREIFEIRRLLEPRAAALAAQALSPAGIAAMECALADARGTLDSGDITLFYRACEQFRSGWLSAVPNRELRETIRRCQAQVQAVRLATMADPPAQRIIVDGQSDLMDAFRRRDAVAAADRMLRFVLAAEETWRRLTGA